MSWRIPLFETDFGPAELEAVQKPVRDGWITMGEITAQLEREFAERCGVKHAIAVNNCTAALHLAVAAAGIGPGDEVICPTLTFVATANAVRYTGATPVFCNSVGPQDLNIGSDEVAARVGPRTRAVLVVHYAGFPADLPGILDVARRHNLIVIEDCAHALFSSLERRTCGSWGLCGAFSFFGNKNMTCGEGGMLTTNDEDVAAKVRILRSHGMTTLTLDRYKGRAFSYDVVAHGYNYRLDEIRSSLALAQLARLDSFLAARENIRSWYLQRLNGTAITVPSFDWERLGRAGGKLGCHIMPVLLPEHCDRAVVMGLMKDAGIQTSVHYPPVHMMSAFADAPGREKAGLQRTERLAARELTLPMYPTLTEEQVDSVCSSLFSAVK